MLIYLDESGDLGFNFKKGASAFFVISFVAMDEPISLELKRVIKKIKQKHRIPRKVEVKGNKDRHALRLDVLRAISSLPIEIYSIVVNKKNIDKHLRNDTNIFYNYMVNLIVIPYLERKKVNEAHIIADLRITRIAKGLRFDDYLKYKLFFEKKLYIELIVEFLDSRKSLGLQAVDFVSYSLFRKYERKDKRYYQIIEKRVKGEKKLFFK